MQLLHRGRCLTEPFIQLTIQLHCHPLGLQPESKNGDYYTNEAFDMRSIPSPQLYHQVSKVFYWPAGATAEWHLSSERAPVLHQGKFIWFDTWCAAHIFTGACVVELGA